ncbi:MAG: hypothetical protein SH850_31135 [Planctomycetaceae bacterium]|nr:hypothetical protein [Planctomycetaceae bacterium]
MTLPQSTPVHSQMARFCLLVVLCIGNVPPLIADDKADHQKLSAKMRGMVKQLATAKGAGFHKLTQQFVELGGEGVPVKRVLCEVIAGQPGIAGQNALIVLEKVSPAAAKFARSLVSAPQGNSGTHAAVFDSYASLFTTLNMEQELDAAVSPILTGTLLNLAKFGNRASTSATSTRNDATYETRRDVCRSGVGLLSRLARDDDAALGDFVSLVGLEVRYAADESHLRTEALRQVGQVTGKDAKRAAIAVPTIVKVLRNAATPPNGPLTSLTAFGAQMGSINQANSALGALREIGPNAASAAPVVRQFLGHPTVGDDARRALDAISG